MWQNDNKTKKCTFCGKEKDLKHYQKTLSAKGGLATRCRQCNKEIGQQYYKINKTQILLRTGDYERKKYKVDTEFAIKRKLRSRFYAALKNQNIPKNKSILHLIDCDIPHLKQYIEKKFVNGMSWNNFGKWHIDHIIPCSCFNLLNIDEQKKCFHHTNLQPLWAIDNLQKSDNINETI
jgi:hypothetical protein